MDCFTDEYYRTRNALKVAAKDWTASLIE